jgi:photosystem II stability/assembly factor-like uncharacterized protein
MKKFYFFILALIFLVVTSRSQPVFSSLTTSSNTNLMGISFADTVTGYACGENGTVIKTTNGGASWTTLTTGNTNRLWDIKIIPGSAGQKVIAVGDNNTVIKSMNGGISWAAQNIPFQAGSFVFGIQCMDSLNYFACGGDYATLTGAVLKTADGGSSWTKTPVNSSVFLDKVFMMNNNYGFTAGSHSGFTDGSIQRTTNGSSFSSVKNSTDLLTNVYCLSAKDIITIGIGGHIWKSTDSGSTWVEHSASGMDLYGISFVNQLTGYACGGSGSGGIILQTKDGGSTWTVVPYPVYTTLQSVCITGNKIFIAGAVGTILKATLSSGVYVADHSVKPAVVELYPNPGSGLLHINNTTQERIHCTLSDVFGKILYEFLCDEGETTYNLSGLNPGVYFYTLSNGQQGKVIRN